MATPYGRSFFLAFLGLLVAYTTAIYFLGKQPNHKLEASEFVSLYQKRPYTTLVTKISKEKHIIVQGLIQDGVDIFADYLLNVTLPEQHIVIHRVFSNVPEIIDETYPHFSQVKNIISEQLPGQSVNKVWIIDSNAALTQAHIKLALQLATSNPNDRIIITAPEVSTKTKYFKKVNYLRPSAQSVQDLLKNQGLNKQQIKIVLQNNNNNLELLSQLINSNRLLDHEKTFTLEKQILIEQLKQTNSKIVSSLKKLCKNGNLASKTEIQELKSLKSVGYSNGNYLWASQNFYKAYESINAEDCKEPTIVIQQIEVSQPKQQAEPQKQTVTENDKTVQQKTKQKKTKATVSKKSKGKSQKKQKK